MIVCTQNAALHLNTSQNQTAVSRGRRGIATTHQHEPSFEASFAK
jgi:hypothetical protein